MSAKLTEGQYKLVSELSGKLLSLDGDIANDGTEVIQWDEVHQQNQLWKLTEVDVEGGDIFYTIEHPNSSMVMEAPGPWKSGVPVVMRHYEHAGDEHHRQWKFEPISNKPGVYKIINRHPYGVDGEDFVIDVKDGDQIEAKKINLQRSWSFPKDHPGERQHWKLVPVGEGQHEEREPVVEGVDTTRRLGVRP